jgi:hypothetical protein
MSGPAENPRRLSALAASDDRLGLGAMFRSARDLPDEDLPTLHWRLRTSQRLRATRPALVLRVVLVVGVVFCTGGVVGAAIWKFWVGPAVHEVPSPAPAAAPPSRPRRARLDSAASVTPASSASERIEATPLAPEPLPLPAAPKPIRASPKRPAAVRVARVDLPAPPATNEEPAMSPPAPAPSAIAAEQALVSQAVRTLRDGHDARAALGLLAEHRGRFPTGALAAEATVLRIEALLDLGRRDEALTILEVTPVAGLPNADEQRVVRGELRAAKGRWREARQDFDEVLGRRALPAPSGRFRNLQERALWGRAAARSRLGDQVGARADLEVYLRTFPDGRFAGPARALVKDAR